MQKALDPTFNKAIGWLPSRKRHPLNTYWTKPSPLSQNSMLPRAILGDGEAGAQYWPRKHTIFDNGRGCVRISVLVLPCFLYNVTTLYFLPWKWKTKSFNLCMFRLKYPQINCPRQTERRHCRERSQTSIKGPRPQLI